MSGKKAGGRRKQNTYFPLFYSAVMAGYKSSQRQKSFCLSLKKMFSFLFYDIQQQLVGSKQNQDILKTREH